MGLFLTLAFLFFVGSLTGWVIELLFRRFVSRANPERKWINPGFCIGPYLPLYGSGLCVLYLVAQVEQFNIIKNPVGNKIVLFLSMAILMTAIEYIAGLFCLKVAKVRLWDYRNEWANLQGLICPKFSLIWAALGALYYFFIHPYIIDALAWLSAHLTFSFFVGLFFGVFIIDVAHSVQLTAKLKQFAEANDVVVRYEHLKTQIRSFRHKNKQKYNFWLPFRLNRPLSEYLKEYADTFEKRKTKNRKK